VFRDAYDDAVGTALPAGADPFMRRQGIQQIRDKVQDCGKAALCSQAGIPPIEAFHSTPN